MSTSEYGSANRSNQVSSNLAVNSQTPFPSFSEEELFPGAQFGTASNTTDPELIQINENLRRITARDNMIIDNAVKNGAQVVSSNSSAKPPQVKTRNAKIDFQDNILNQYENYTYHIKFFTCSEAARHSDVAEYPQVIIAESGTTGINIEDLNITAIVHPSGENLSSMAHTFEFTIVEPFNSSFYDLAERATSAVGVRDRISAPYWLEIGFRGYNENGTIAGNNNGIESWIHRERIQISKVQSTIDAGGARHKISAVPFNEIGMKDESTRLNRTISISAETFGDFLYYLELAMNYSEPNRVENPQTRQAQNKSTATDLQRNIYKIKLSDELENANIRNWKLRGDNKNGHKLSQDPNNKDRWITTKNKNDSFLSWINDVLSTTQEAQKLGIWGKVEAPDPDEAGCKGKEKNPLDPSKIFYYDPEVEVINYNSDTKNYNLYVTYYIRLYESFIPYVSVNDVQQVQKMEKERAKSYAETRSLLKRYNYQYTGENTEVLEFSVEVDHAWQITLPEFGGYSKTESQNASGAVDTTKTVKQPASKNVEKQSRTGSTSGDDCNAADQENIPLDEQLPNQNTNDNQNGDPTAQALDQAENNAYKDADTLKPGQTLADLSKPSTASDNGAQELSKLILAPDSTQIVGATSRQLREQERAINLIQTRQSRIAQTRQDFLLGTAGSSGNLLSNSYGVNDQGQVGISRTAEDLRLSQDLKRIIKIGKDPLTDSGKSVENTASAGRTFLNTVLNQIYGNNGSLADLEITIRGDPYWFGTPEVVLRANDQQNNTLNYTSGDSLVLVTSNWAVPYDDQDGSYNSEKGTGLSLINNSNRDTNGLNAIYLIHEVQHSFSGGKFTQKLMGKIDPFTSDSSVRALLEDS